MSSTVCVHIEVEQSPSLQATFAVRLAGQGTDVWQPIPAPAVIDLCQRHAGHRAHISPSLLYHPLHSRSCPAPTIPLYMHG